MPDLAAGLVRRGDRPDAARALAVCAGCPVLRDCFLAAAADRAESGVWGGVNLSAADRTAGKAAAS
jgi:Transcription factor WhiB